MDIGRLTRLAETGLCTVDAFAHHHDRRHVDPPGEEAAADTLILTRTGTWAVNGRRGGGGVACGALVTLEAGEEYVCRHADERPDDTTISVELRAGALPLDGYPTTIVALDRAGEALVTALVEELRRDRPDRDLVIDGAVAGLAALAARAEPAPARRHREAMHAVAEHMAAHLDQELTLADLARVAHLSPWYVSRLFAQVHGLPPRRYLLRLRVAEAARLLDESGLTVLEVAHRTGFRSLAHFRASFRGQLGTSPAEWRKRAARSGKRPSPLRSDRT